MKKILSWYNNLSLEEGLDIVNNILDIAIIISLAGLISKHL